MGQLLCNGAVLKCSFGMTPTALIVLPANRVLACSMPAANIMDYKPLINIPTFGMCQSAVNPTVITATAAALGVLTPMPCIPNTIAPWTPGNAKALIGSMPVISNSSKLVCLWGGMITVTSPGQTTVQT